MLSMYGREAKKPVGTWEASTYRRLLKHPSLHGLFIIKLIQWFQSVLNEEASATFYVGTSKER